MSRSTPQTEASAAVFTGAGKPMEIRSLPIPALSAGDVLVRIRLCSICGSDLHTVHGRRTSPTPTILGHEAVGEIAEISCTGAVDCNGQPLRLGQRITWSIVHHCGECFFCLHGLPQKCGKLSKFGHEAISPSHALVGGLAEFCHLKKGAAIVPIPDGLPDAIVCPCNCATATIAGTFRAAGPVDDEVVLVQGAGLLGLTACAMADAEGARAIVVTDVNPHRLELARRFGATHSVNVADADAGAAMLTGVARDLTDGRGMDVAFELSGAPEAFPTAIKHLRIGGRYILAGGVFPAPAVQISEETLVRRMLMIQGWHNYAPSDLRAAVAFLDRHHRNYPFAELLTDIFPLRDINRAFTQATDSRAVRVGVSP